MLQLSLVLDGIYKEVYMEVGTNINDIVIYTLVPMLLKEIILHAATGGSISLVSLLTILIGRYQMC